MMHNNFFLWLFETEKNMSDPMQGILAEAKSNKYSLIKDKLSEDGKSL